MPQTEENKSDKKLSRYTTFRLGGNCHELIDCRTAEEVIPAARHLIKQHQRYVLMGGGSNILVSDHGYSGTVIRYVNPLPDISCNGNIIHVSGATLAKDLAAYLVKHGHDGLMFLCGIPGTIGGAVAGNAGAWGEQIGDRARSAILLNKYGNVSTVPAEELEFSYRKSRIQRTGEIILSVEFETIPGHPEALRAQGKKILALRKKKHPHWKTTPCCGSIFKNIEPTSHVTQRQSAGYFLERSGALNMREGSAQVFPRHANIIIAKEGCTAQQVYDLHLLMKKAVKDTFCIELAREIKCLGNFKNAPKHLDFF